MARPLGILVAGGWYQVSSRGNRGEAIYRTDADRRRFLGLVAELPERFGLEVDKARQRQSRVAGGLEPGAELVRKRLQELKDYRWSSWRVYQGAEVALTSGS